VIARLRCLLAGHAPSDLPGWRDWVGRPIQCARCRIYDTEMSPAARERFYGRAARRDWNAKALRRMAWARYRLMWEARHGR